MLGGLTLRFEERFMLDLANQPTTPPPSRAEPPLVRAILSWQGTWFVARLALVSAYVVGGLVKIVDIPAAIAEQTHFGLVPPALWAGITIIVELVGSVLVLSGRLVWLGAGMLGVLTAAATIVANRFWSMTGEARFMATNAFFEHVGLIGGLIAVAILASENQRQR